MRPDVLDACARRDLGAVISALGSAGITQGQISALTGVSQGRLSEWMTGKREPKSVSSFQKFADGVGLPAAARRALGLDPAAATPADAVTAADTTLSYPDGVAQATENVAALWRADLADASAFLHGRFDPRAWGDASLRWLVDPGCMPMQERARGALIGTGDVTRFRATVDMFAELDNRFGGGHAREALVKYLSLLFNPCFPCCPESLVLPGVSW